MNDMRDMVVLVTGATSGIGRASAIRFAKAGATVIATGRNENAGKELTDEIKESGGCGEFCRLDVTKKEDITQVIRMIEEKYKKLDAVFVNAGYFDRHDFKDITKENTAQCIDTCLWGCINTIQGSLDVLIRSGGSIVNTVSICGLDSFTDDNYIYSAMKAAILKLTKQLAKKYAGQIRVNAICPGSTETSFVEGLDFRELERVLPSGRVGQPEDMAAAANFLFSKDASYITGAVLTIDGGESL